MIIRKQKKEELYPMERALELEVRKFSCWDSRPISESSRASLFSSVNHMRDSMSFIVLLWGLFRIKKLHTHVKSTHTRTITACNINKHLFGEAQQGTDPLYSERLGKPRRGRGVVGHYKGRAGGVGREPTWCSWIIAEWRKIRRLRVGSQPYHSWAVSPWASYLSLCSFPHL